MYQLNPIDSHPLDTGCEYSPRCTECPFGDCIKELRYREQQLILNGKTIYNVIACKECGMTPEQIKRLFDTIPIGQIRYWTKNKQTIKNKLEKYCIGAYACV